MVFISYDGLKHLCHGSERFKEIEAWADELEGQIFDLDIDSLCRAREGVTDMELQVVEKNWIVEQSGSNIIELLNIQNETEYPINGRDLHEKLGIETQYSKWIQRMCEYGFEENQDFQTLAKNVYRPDGVKMPVSQIDHHLTLSMAKELCMLQRTDRGREVRRYLISIEEKWNQPDAVIARALQMAGRKLDAITAELRHLGDANKRLATEVDILSGENSTWDDRTIITTLLPAIAAKLHTTISDAYNQFYRELKKKYHIDLCRRRDNYQGSSHRAIIDFASPSEMPLLAKLSATIACRNRVDFVSLLNKVNAKRVRETVDAEMVI